MPQLTITHPDGSTETISGTNAPEDTANWKWERRLGEMWKLKIRVDRNDAQSVTLNKKEDEIELSGVATGQLTDIHRGGPTWTLVVRSFEWLATTEPPTAGGVKRTQTDAEHMDQFINDIPDWSIGTTTAQTGNITFVFNHAFANEGMRRVERNAPGELQWNDDKSVDYLDRLGSDKSASITLQPGNDNLDDDIQVLDKGVDIDATHVKLIGAQQGEAQLFAHLVPSDDTTAQSNLDNVVTYTTARWSDDSDTDWARRSNKDLISQSAVDEAANALAEELTEIHIRVQATVVGEDLQLGDTVHVTKSEADIDRDMRIHRIVTKAFGTTEVDVVELSTRNVARSDLDDLVADIQRFNVAFQGTPVMPQVSGGMQVIDPGPPVRYELPFYYPASDFEHKVELFVETFHYRSFVEAAGHTHDVTHPSHTHDVTHPSHTHDVTHPSHTHDVTHPSHTHDVTHPSHSHDVSATSTSIGGQGLIDSEKKQTDNVSLTGGQWNILNDFVTPSTDQRGGMAAVMIRKQSTGTSDLNVRVAFSDNSTVGTDFHLPTSSGAFYVDMNENMWITLPVLWKENLNDWTVQFQAKPASDATVDVTSVIYYAPQHNHDVSDTTTTELGTTETSTTALGTTETSTTALGTTETSTTALGTTETSTSTVGFDPGANIWDGTDRSPKLDATNMDVIINGTEELTDIGSGTFQTVEDISGIANQGQWNTIQLTSEEKCVAHAVVSVEATRQIGTN